MDEADALSETVGSLTGRLELLMAHLVGEALGRRVDRADLVQETLLRLLRSRGTTQAAVQGQGSLWSFARTMARRVVADAARSARGAPRRLSSLVPESTSSGAVEPTTGKYVPGPGTLAAGRELGECWLGAFRRLSPEHRRVLGLRRFEGLSARETAARMGSTETAVHSLFRRALAAWETETAMAGRLSEEK